MNTELPVQARPTSWPVVESRAGTGRPHGSVWGDGAGSIPATRKRVAQVMDHGHVDQMIGAAIEEERLSECPATFNDPIHAYPVDTYKPLC